MVFTDGGWYELSSTVSDPTLDINDRFMPAEQTSATYNLAGQKVDDSYKGIVIRNGRKFYRK